MSMVDRRVHTTAAMVVVAVLEGPPGLDFNLRLLLISVSVDTKVCRLCTISM